MKNVNFYKNLNGTEVHIENLSSLLTKIKNGVWKTQIDEIRNLLNENEKIKASELKKKLPAFTTSGTFRERRKKDCIDSYSGLIQLDYDKIEDVLTLKQRIIEIPFTYSAFISPSGNGLKVIINTDAVIENHTSTFNEIRAYYDGIVGYESDKSVKDVTRLCFVSDDNNLYLNESASIFALNHTLTNSTINAPYVWNFTSNKAEFTEGKRNNFIYSFACNTNRFGIDINDAISYSTNFCSDTFLLNEVERTIKSAYENNLNEFGMFAKTSKTSNVSIEVEENNPIIPEKVYKTLPKTLKEACEVFEGRERDVFFTSALSVLSGGFFNVFGYYSNEVVHPNLFSFIVAPPASGKGSMKYAKQLGDCYHYYLLNLSKEANDIYKKEKRIFDRKIKKAKSDEEIEQIKEPIAPKAKLFFIPADTSSSMLIKHLADNDGLGCICETETDTVTNAIGKEWGGYSDLLRKGFQSEVISKSRITDLQYIEVSDPKFSLTITGTPNQMGSLITSVEDGLFSRFLFYSFTSEPKWNSTYTSEISNSKKEIFSNFSADLCDKFKNNGSQKFYMTLEQGNELDRRFTEALKHNSEHYSSPVYGVTYRLGLMAFKIAMVLTALRSDESEIYCSDEDFETSMFLVEKVYMTHSINMLSKYAEPKKSYKYIEQKLLEWIPNDKSFTRTDISPVAESLGIGSRTLTTYLDKFIKLELVEREKNGVYRLTHRVA